LPELRTDPISGRWVIIATERAARPTDFKTPAVEVNDIDRCPFCLGREGMTPPEIYAVRGAHSVANGPGWQVRVVSNKFPALRIEGNTAQSAVGMFTRMDVVGAHETWLLPKQHAASFGETTDAETVPCAEVLQKALHALHVCLGNPPYNFIVHTAPYHYQARHAYHWHIEIMPRLTQVAGFEWGSGFFINPVVPEAAARFLREAANAAPTGAAEGRESDHAREG
jgi:galactose-1-phosphate uridylyltransferase